MEEHIVKIISIEPETHDTRHLVVEKPKGYTYIPGQATEVAVNKPDWKDEKHPFTFTSLNTNPHLEFIIKIYNDHHGVTEQIGKLKPGDEIILHDVWGTINYDGAGYFIAGGAGITPFIAILRQLSNDGKLEDNTLLFSNKTDHDIILKDEFEKMLGENAIFTVTDQKTSKYETRLIDEAFLKGYITDWSKKFYVCGPDLMVKDIKKVLSKMGAKADEVVFEK